MRTLVALLFILGLSACGGVVEEAELSNVEQDLTPCLSACWGSCPVKNLECREGCEVQCAEGVSAMGPIGGTCGAFRQRCCLDNACNYGLECDPSSGTCLY